MFDLGAAVTLTHTFRDSNGNPTSPDSIVVTIQLPDLSTTTATAVKDSDSVYHITYTPALTGRFAVTWVPTGGDTQAFSDVFNVSAQFSPAIVGLDEMRAKLNKKSTADDDLVRGILRAATAVIEGLCGPCAPRPVTETISVSGGGVSALVLSCPPVLTVTAITPLTPYLLTPDLSSIQIDAANGILTSSVGNLFAGKYSVNYTAGRSIIPNALQEACLLVGRNLYTLQRGGTIAAPNMASDDISMDPSLMLAVSPRVRELLASELLAPGV